MASVYYILLSLACFVCICNGSYIITLPKALLFGTNVQVCLEVKNPESPAGTLDIGIHSTHTIQQSRRKREVLFPPYEFKIKTVLLEPIKLQVPPGNHYLCESIDVPALPESHKTTYYQYYVSVTGYIDGVSVNHTTEIHKEYGGVRTFIQTDKYLYKPGQNVQFRVLSHSGPLMEILTEPYKEIYVTSPSRNRIAQWLDVDNSKGLVHLSLQLADEPEEGSYVIQVQLNQSGSARVIFKVEEYVLPRFEVTVDRPKHILGTDSSISFGACAKYTFGKPVKGNISWEISNLQNYGCRVTYVKNDTISGCSNITVTSSNLRLTDCDVYRINANATVTEEGTGAEETGQGQVVVSRNAVTFQVLKQDDYMKPNLPYTLKVLAKSPDGSPAANELLEVCHGNSCNNITTPANGVLKVYLTDRNSKKVVIQSLITRASMQLSTFSTQVKKFFSPSNSSLLIHTSEETIKCMPGKDTQYIVPVLFAAVKQQAAAVNVQVMARGKIQYWKSQQYQLSPSVLPIEEEFLLEPLSPSPPDVVTGVINIPLTLPATASPKIRVLVWYIRDDGEVISDVKDMTVEKCLPNSVDLIWSTNRTEPGNKASWTIASTPNSLCSLGVVDKSVELVSQRTDVMTVDSLFLKDHEYRLATWRMQQANDRVYCKKKLETEVLDQEIYNYYSNYVDALHMFDESGLYAFSNLELQTRPCEKQEIQRRYFSPPVVRGGGLVDVRISGGSTSSHSAFGGDNTRIKFGSASNEISSPRTEFPETWLWDLVLVPSSGVASKEITVPDTITEWVGKAVCVHPQKGLGVSEKTSLTTFTPFFVDLTLPPSIKRGEVLPVKISVFNYLQQSLPVRVSLESSPEYDFIGEEAVGSPGHRLTCVGAQDNFIHTVKIRPSVIGEVNLTVVAYVDTGSSLPCSSGVANVNKRDALIRPITVEADGFLREKTWNKYICANEVASGEDTLETSELSVPAGMIEGSERAWITAVGDLLAISLEHIGSLIRMPYGCGEQNMLNFAPNIFILKYLKVTRQETPEATSKLLNFMRTGYQRQLLYRHDNGSYSAFGKADVSGSTWLTAFVLKSFAQAKPFVVIDEARLNTTQLWLINSYGKNQCAVNIGKVFNKGMKGGLNKQGTSTVPLTAYILISLLESGIDRQHEKVRNGLQCILSETSRNPYTLSLQAYALALAKAPEAQKAIEQLLQLAIELKNSTHWELPKGLGSKTLQVETAGYAILAMMTYDSSLYGLKARKIVKWISGQRNGRGGFYSTQDTVVALQALAIYESTQYQGNLDVSIVAETPELSHTFIIKESNKLVHQQAPVPTLPANVSFSITGQGCAVLQTVLRYNDPEPEASDAFSIRVNSRTEPDTFCITKRISACASYLLPDGVSNMAVIEVNLVSGYIPEKEDLKQLVENNADVIKRYDIDGNKLSFYIDEFTDQDVCVNFRVIRQVDVEETKPGSVVVYDYYQPEFSVSKTYNLPVATQCY